MYLLTEEGVKYIKKRSSFKQCHCKHKIVKGEHCLSDGKTRIGYAEIFEVCKKCGKVFNSYKLVK
ncbi:hypothetical protein UT300012_32770 [Paraclostridium bifermentans]